MYLSSLIAYEHQMLIQLVVLLSLVVARVALSASAAPAVPSSPVVLEALVCPVLEHQLVLAVHVVLYAEVLHQQVFLDLTIEGEEHLVPSRHVVHPIVEDVQCSSVVPQDSGPVPTVLLVVRPACAVDSAVTAYSAS